MKRCWRKGKILPIMLLTSLFIFLACGIPTYLSLDSDITIAKHTDGTVGANINVATTAPAKFTEYFGAGEGPSLKLFYVISPNIYRNPVTNNELDSQYFSTSYVESIFRTLYRNNGNGRQWSPESTSASDPAAPGFFIYTDNKDNLRESSSSRPEDLAETPAGILVGTFAKSATANDSDSSAYSFGSSPAMDLTIPDTSFSFTLSLEPITPSGSSFPVNGVPSYLLKLTTDEATPTILYLTDYKKNPFVDTTSWTKTDFSNQYLEEDGYFYRNLVDEYSSTLYMHVWAAVYANGEYFTNIYWSDLEYLGSIPL